MGKWNGETICGEVNSSRTEVVRGPYQAQGLEPTLTEVPANRGNTVLFTELVFRPGNLTFPGETWPGE
jgi:hypothetical protein